ncbi:DUF2784 domain-containing protein [Solitalea longa]|uniref:DUF2784 domain-containing protein n=1 Tax=Solitalea longa TaxID=2079460 RepID=A0A2S5AAQ1_9SPHI|nr:DUF2784 domain-containing protein [Solitalea longa]POY39307.1 DUF2784 domain-containing protein [Solitalea longa]
MDKGIYLLLTQVTVIIHFAFILFVVAGGFFAHKNRWIKVIHMVSVAWAIFAELSYGVVCPLTAIENYFGYHAGLSTYQEDFITRHLIPIIYQENLSPFIQYILVGIVIGINLIAYKIRWKQSKFNS